MEIFRECYVVSFLLFHFIYLFLMIALFISALYKKFSRNIFNIVEDVLTFSLPCLMMWGSARPRLLFLSFVSCSLHQSDMNNTGA